MKALSIRQPWTYLLATGLKPVENRTWPTNFRGEVLLHAGLHYDKQGDAWIRATFPEIQLPRELPLGGIVGVATLTDCVTTHPSRYFFGPHGFVMAQARQLPFRPHPGKLGFFDVPDEIASPLLANIATQAEAEAAGQERLF